MNIGGRHADFLGKSTQRPIVPAGFEFAYWVYHGPTMAYALGVDKHPFSRMLTSISRCGDTGWLDGDPVRGISDEPCGCDENWEE